MSETSRLVSRAPQCPTVNHDRRVAISPRSLRAAVGSLGLLTVFMTSAGGCDNTKMSSGTGAQGGGAVGGQFGDDTGGQTGSGVSGGAGGLAGGGAGGQMGTGPGMSVVVAGDTRTVVVEDQGGGFTAPAPAGSECQRGVLTYTITFGENSLAWHVCTEGDVFTFVDGSRALKSAEFERMYEALQAVVVSSSTSCGADKSTRLMTVTRANDSVTYLDSFYACLNRGIYVDGIDNVISVAASLAASPVN